MTTILFTFISAFLFSIVTTPFVNKLALHFGLVDNPSARKVHEKAIPRIGGVAIFFAFFFPFALLYFLREESGAATLLFNDTRVTGFVLGGIIIFCLGLLDDIRGLSTSIKFAGQIAAALVAYSWGFQINIVSIPFAEGLPLGYFGLPATVFWFVLVINAINLVDGLDGLAAGIGIFVSLTMLFICTTSNLIVEALTFAAIGGALIGFLRYNFNPASIFMGDGGSYFLGYSLAALSIAGSIKGQVATAMLIPVIALGIPLIDTLWAPVRRFVFGQKIFQPDREHFHHRLVQMGYTQQRAVLLIYFLTIVLGIAAIVIVHTQNDMAALILAVLGAGAIFLSRYMGVADFITMRKMFTWAQDLSDEAGISHDRRKFLNYQVEISQALDLDTLWAALGEAFEFLEFDVAEFSYFDRQSPGDAGCIKKNFKWQLDSDFNFEGLRQNYLLKIELPLHSINGGNDRNFGTLLLIKNMREELASHYTLKRVEHLRRTIVSTLVKINPS